MYSKTQRTPTMLTKKTDNDVAVTAFIDKDEVEEMLCEYYDFQSVSNEQWIALDHLIKKMCEERGVIADYTDDYARICDVCCEILHFPLI